VITRPFVVALAVACSLWACTSVAPAPQPVDLGLDEAPPASVERLIEPTPAMLEAALAGDPSKMQLAAATLTSCAAPSSCPAGFGSCTAWSAPAECSVTCTENRVCTCPPMPEHPDTPPEVCVPDLSVRLGHRTLSSFRVCFNAAQQACTEFQQSSNFFCGC
jgi:hypothetical protein